MPQAIARRLTHGGRRDRGGCDIHRAVAHRRPAASRDVWGWDGWRRSVRNLRAGEIEIGTVCMLLAVSCDGGEKKKCGEQERE